MKFSINYSQLTAEFIIVVVGVAVALAADGWRQGLSDKSLESSYIERLALDLEQGRFEMQRTRERLSQANDGARGLLTLLESNTINENKEIAIENFAYAAMTGGFSNAFRHDYTYQELITTGRLQLIADADIRRGLATYFSDVASLSRERDRLPSQVFDRFRELAGSSPTMFIDRGETITQAERERLLRHLIDDSSFEREVRYLVSRLEIIDVNFEYRIEANLNGSRMLKNYGI